METSPKLFNPTALTQYLEDHHHMQYEKDLLNEILQSIQNNDTRKLAWFAQFGETLRLIVFNVNAYRKGLQFGFTDIRFDPYGWLKRPTFLDQQELHFGLTEQDRYGSYSTITIGRGLNHIWTYGLSVSYGTAGSSSGICVYGQVFSSKEETLKQALQKLRAMMVEKVGNIDTTNYNQKIILATLKSIADMEVSQVQLSLF
ncbi:hypothetical protein [Pedobacter agri]|uniref:hypothetical protein n=1 Tax=Pedobacter agri TaxID=454586 RepID=UPI00293012C9|nr:hypothetical protein [Pedobacter agri]